MAETIEVKKDIEITCKCSACGDELEFCGTADAYGDVTLDVYICKCAVKDEE